MRQAEISSPAAKTEVPGLIPWEIRLGLALRLSPLATGLVVAAVLVSGALVFRTLVLASGLALEPGPTDLDFATRVALVASLTIGYTIGVWRWIAREQYRDVAEAIGEAVALEIDRHEAIVHEVPAAYVRRSRWAGLAGVVFFVCTVEGPNLLWGGRPGAAWVGLHALTYMLALGVLFFWTAGRAAYFSIASLPHERAHLDAGAAVHLLDRRRMRVTGRMALRNSLSWVVGVSIASLAFVNPELQLRASLLVFGPCLVATLAIASAALLLPTRDVHRQLVRLKRAELERVDAAIRGERSALADSGLAEQAEALSLADLVAYRGLIEAAPEWPFDASLAKRLGLYLLIPLASWTAAALVERSINLLLD